MNRPGIAAILSLLLPGLGQAWLGARRRGLLIALPLVAGAAILAIVILRDPKAALDTILSKGAIGIVLVLIVGLAVYHLAAILGAFRLGNRLATASAAETDTGAAQNVAPKRRATFLSPLLLVALAAVIGLYGTIEFVGVRAIQATTAIFADPSSGYAIPPSSSFAPRPTPTQGPIPTGPITEPPAPTATPEPGPAWAADGRLNLLLIGSDEGPGRWLARMDSINVVSVDIASGRAAIFSIWRYTGNVPLPPESAGKYKNGRDPEWLNAIYVEAMGDPKHFPGGEARGFRATAGAVQELIGQPIDGAIVVNLNGFVDLVDAVGGMWIDIPFAVHDPHYALPNGRGYIELNFSAGCQKLDGERALEYARTRHQDSDYGRMRRQQRVIVTMARQLDPIAMLPRVGKLLEIARDNLWTTIQPDEVADLAQLAARVDFKTIQYYLFWPPETPQRLNTAGIQHIRDVVAGIFDAPVTATPEPTREPNDCPRP